MNPPSITVQLALLWGAYFLGAIPFGIIVARLLGGVDPRTAGSGNIGATNVLRTSGKVAGAITLLLDAVKGAVPVFAARHFDAPPTTVAVVGLIAIVGHIYPIFLKFKGGKGVATAAGVFLAAVPISAVSALVAWLTTLMLWRIASLASMVAALALPAMTYLYYPDKVYLVMALGASMLVLSRHAGNLQRLIRGKEPSIGGEAENPEAPSAPRQ